jgi:arabinogalactan oligomer/maltooligosaccharide transport system permease protein
MTVEPLQGGLAVATAERVEPSSVAVKQTAPRRPGGGVWWRHLLAVVAIVWALFPIVFIVSAAINPSGTLNTAELLPTRMSWSNFDALFNDPARPYTSWYRNSMIVAGVGSLASVFLGACAAYAFSRLRFTGRRPGLLALLLFQMFPALLAFVALYITFDKIGDVLPAIGLNSVYGLMLCYLGGAMGASRAEQFNRQGGRYRVGIRGVDQGAIVDRVEEVASVSRALSAQADWNEVLRLATTPELRAVISNTTEAG